MTPVSTSVPTHTTPRKTVTTTLAVVSIMGLVAGCTTVPGDSTPQALRSFAPAQSNIDVPSPVPGREPDLLLRDFFTASANPIQNYQAASSFLSPDMASQWDNQSNTLILDRIDLNANAGATADRISYIVRGTVVGNMSTGGVYAPENGDYEASIELRKINGEWRITSLPPGVILEKVELRNNYQPHELYFLDPTGRFLVRDRRWVYNGQPSTGSALLSLMVEGPQRGIAPGVVNEVPEGAVFSGMKDGAYTFIGFGELNADQRHRFAAQVVWTLARAGVAGPYRVTLDGVPLEIGQAGLSVEDVAEFNPNVGVGSLSPLYALSNGQLYVVSSDRVDLAPGRWGAQDAQLESADISATGDVVAAVQTTGEGDDKKSQVLLGPLNGETTTALERRTLSRPSLEYDASAFWTVLDGTTIARVSRSSATGEMSQIEVDKDAFGDATGAISVLRLSHSGVRVAMIIDGRVYLGTVSRPAPGERKITNLVQIAPSIGNTALTLDWQHDGSLLVGTSSPDTPVRRVELDGSEVTPLSAGNITAPVVAVASSTNNIYVTDSRAVLQLPSNGPSSAFWREVPALQGTRAAPVVAH